MTGLFFSIKLTVIIMVMATQKEKPCNIMKVLLNICSKKSLAISRQLLVGYLFFYVSIGYFVWMPGQNEGFI
ncbi:hypothetical protein SEES4314_10582 [Salmonella enterica subsp. enterica serovar Senftenberg str. 604314]|nr:hypothetical protein SEES4314_10582 [Salmonella enterica subsp. enterica serovar Senftenberg str. 604314]